MKQTPRYDPTNRDPASIKAALAQIFNETLVQLWLNSPLKDNITIGTHNLECHGGIRDMRYRQGGKYDGLHFWGPSGNKSYTESVLEIFRNDGLIKSSPPRYYRHYHKTEPQTKPDDKYHCPTQDIRQNTDANVASASVYTVPTNNRPSTFNLEN